MVLRHLLENADSEQHERGGGHVREEGRHIVEVALGSYSFGEVKQGSGHREEDMHNEDDVLPDDHGGMESTLVEPHCLEKKVATSWLLHWLGGLLHLI
jgi:hypothetical protein